MVEKSDVVEECSSCVRLKEEIEIARRDQAATLKMIKEKIMSTDKLIKKYQKKCDDFDKQAKLFNDLTTKHENCERNSEILQEQLNHSLEVTEPQKKTIKRLIQEKFVAEETIQDLKQKSIDQEEVINHLKQGLQLRDEKDSSWKLEQQLQAKQIEKEKKKVEKLMKDLEKAKEEIKKGKVLVKDKNRELRGAGRRCDNLEIQVKKLKEELKYAKKDTNNLNKRKLSPREFNIARTTRQSAKRCEEKLTEILSNSTKECNSPTGKKPPLTSIFDEMTKLALPLSPVPPSPTESNDSSSEFSDDYSSGSDFDGGSLGDLGEMLELTLENKDASTVEAGTVDNLSVDEDKPGSDFDGGSLGDHEEMPELKLENKDASKGEAGTVDNLSVVEDQLGCLGTESGDEDVEEKIKSVSAARNSNNSEISEENIQEESDKEIIPESYQKKGQRTPEKRQSKQQEKSSTLESSDSDESPLSAVKHAAIISSEELISVAATSKVSSELSTLNPTAKNIDTDEITLEAVENGTNVTDKMERASFEETMEEVDIKNNNLSLSSLDEELKEGFSEADERENDNLRGNDKETCSQKKNGMPDIHVTSKDVRTESAEVADSAIKDNTCRVESRVGHTSGNKTALDELLSEKTDVKSLDLDKSKSKEVIATSPSKFKDGDDEFADYTKKVISGVEDDEEIPTKDEPVSDNIQHKESVDENTSKHAEYANKVMENETEADSGKLRVIKRLDASRKCGLSAFDDKNDTLLNKTKIVKDSLKKVEDVLPEQEHKMECDLGNKLDENIGLLGETLADNIDEEGTSSPKGDTEKNELNLTVKNSSSKIHKQTSKKTKCLEKSITLSGNGDREKTCFLGNDGGKVLGKEELVDKNLKGTKRSNTEVCGTRKRLKKVAFQEVVASTHVNSTSTEASNATLIGTQKQNDSNLSTAEATEDKNDTVSARITNFNNLQSSEKPLLNNNTKSSNADDHSVKRHLDSIGDSSELLNKLKSMENSSSKTVDTKDVSHHCDSTKSKETTTDKSGLIMDESTEEVLEEGETTNKPTNTSIVTQTFLQHKSEVHLSNQNVFGIEGDGSKMMEFEALTSDGVASSNVIDKNNLEDDSSDFNAVKETISTDPCDKAKSKSTISDPLILSLSSVLNDCFGVFDEEMPVLSPLPHSPSSSRESSPTYEFEIEEERPLAHFTSLPTIYAASKSSNAMRSLASASRISSASSVTQTSPTAKGHTAPAKYKELDSPLTLEPDTPKEDVSRPEGHEQVEKQKKKKKVNVQLSVRPYFLSEIRYAEKVFRFLTREHLRIEDVVSRLSSLKTMSNGTPLAAALVKFQHNEDLMPIIIQKYHDRDRQHQDQASRLTHLNNWTPVLTIFEERVFEMVTRLTHVEHMKGLSTKIISLLSRSIIHSCSVAEEPDKKCVASKCRLLSALCRNESKLQHMRVLCYDIIRSLYSRPGTVLYLMISIAAVWPTVLASSALTSSTGLVCLAGESYQPLPCTIQMVLTTWARSNDWVLLGNVLDWLCAWKQVPSGEVSLKQLAEELVKLIKDPLSAQLMHGRDGNPILGFGLYEVVKALELVTCVLGWAWLNNVLVRGYLWDVLARWVTRIQPGTHCADTTTPCSNDGSCNDGSKTVDLSLDPSLSTSCSKNKEDSQGTATPCLNDVSCNGGSKADHPSLRSSLSMSGSTNMDETQGTNHSTDTSNNTGVLDNDPQGGTNPFFEATVVAAVRLLGLACRIATQHYQTIPRVIPLLVGLLQPAQDCSVPYAVQLASAYSLLEVSPWQPGRVVSVLEEWKIVQEKSNKLPESFIQGLNSLKLCLQPSKDSSLLLENCVRTEDRKYEDNEY